MLTDERYGPVGHPDSNARQLADIGFDPKHALFIPVLTGGTPNETVCAYRVAAREQLAAKDVAIGQFGIGTDGHIAGILPGSSAAAEKHELAVGYQTPEFLRISLTAPAIRQLDMAYALVYGATKREALTRLHDHELPIEQQPAQILKAIPEAYVYNDQVEA
jgi:6-phosphogluconolactonase/glucosamine-6-phosphate isomerase/deaminase